MDKQHVRDIAALFDHDKAFKSANQGLQIAELSKIVGDPSGDIIGHLAAQLFAAIAYIDKLEGKLDD